MKKQKLLKQILLITCGLFIFFALSACQPRVVSPSESPTATQQAGDSTNSDPTAIAGSDEASAADSVVEYLENLPIPTPDFSSEQVENPVAKMNSPESLEGSGAFPDNYFTSDILHTGSRGCLSCHADLYSLIKNLGPTLHVASHSTYGKQDDILDCKTCHDVADNLTGPKLADIMHASHWNNELFEDTYNGSCWSCHVIDTDGEMALWDAVKYDASLAGFPNATSDGVISWQKARGFETGNMIGFDMVEDLELEIVEEE